MLLRRMEGGAAIGEPCTLQPIVDSLFQQVSTVPRPTLQTDSPATTTETGVAVFPGHVVKTERPVLLQFDRYSPPAQPSLSARSRHILTVCCCHHEMIPVLPFSLVG